MYKNRQNSETLFICRQQTAFRMSWQELLLYELNQSLIKDIHKFVYTFKSARTQGTTSETT